MRFGSSGAGQPVLTRSSVQRWALPRFSFCTWIHPWQKSGILSKKQQQLIDHLFQRPTYPRLPPKGLARGAQDLPLAVVLISTWAGFWIEGFQIAEGRTTCGVTGCIYKRLSLNKFLNKGVIKTWKMIFHEWMRKIFELVILERICIAVCNVWSLFVNSAVELLTFAFFLSGDLSRLRCYSLIT